MHKLYQLHLWRFLEHWLLSVIVHLVFWSIKRKFKWIGSMNTNTKALYVGGGLSLSLSRFLWGNYLNRLTNSTSQKCVNGLGGMEWMGCGNRTWQHTQGPVNHSLNQTQESLHQESVLIRSKVIKSHLVFRPQQYARKNNMYLKHLVFRQCTAVWKRCFMLFQSLFLSRRWENSEFQAVWNVA